MKRADAEKLVGQRVQIWTAANGIYVGVLEAVFGSPWRGRTRITGIISPAQHYERGGVCRRGFRPGEIIEAGNSSIRLAHGEGSESYLSVLEAEIAKCELSFQQYPNSPSAWVWPAFAAAYRAAAKAERQRLATGVWELNQEKSGT